MEKKTSRPMTPFDEWTVPNELHTMKLLLPYTPADSQPVLGMLIKVIELQHTMEYFQHTKKSMHSQDLSSGFSSPLDILDEISPYLPPEQAGMIDTFRNMMNIMDMVQMMQVFSDSNEAPPADPDGRGEENPSAGSGSPDTRPPFTDSSDHDNREASTKTDGLGSRFNPMNLVMGMLSPEQQEMFEMYQTMFSQPEESMDTSTESPEYTAFGAQDDDTSDDAAFDIQDNDAYSNKERNDIGYE